MTWEGGKQEHEVVKYVAQNLENAKNSRKELDFILSRIPSSAQSPILEAFAGSLPLLIAFLLGHLLFWQYGIYVHKEEIN